MPTGRYVSRARRWKQKEVIIRAAGSSEKNVDYDRRLSLFNYVHINRFLHKAKRLVHDDGRKGSRKEGGW